MKKLKDGIKAAMHACSYWGMDVATAAAEAGKTGKIPVNAALKVVTESLPVEEAPGYDPAAAVRPLRTPSTAMNANV